MTQIVVLLRLQPDHDRPHDVTQLAPGDTVYAQFSSGDHSPAAEADTEQHPAEDSPGGQLWEEVTILSFQHGGHIVQVAATADASRTTTVAVDDLVLTPFADDPSGSDSDAASDGGADSDGDADMRPMGRGASSGHHDEYQPAPAIPHDGDAELNPVSFRSLQGWHLLAVLSRGYLCRLHLCRGAGTHLSPGSGLLAARVVSNCPDAVVQLSTSTSRTLEM